MFRVHLLSIVPYLICLLFDGCLLFFKFIICLCVHFGLLGTVVPTGDNYFAALNSAVFSDGSFCYIPKGTRCPMEISTYFRINNKDSGQFERTLLVAEEGSYVSYLEGCTAPMFDSFPPHT